MSALAASAAYAAPGAARALRRCAARARRGPPRRDRRKSFGFLFDRREGAPACARPASPARSARARVGGVPARPGASSARAARRDPRADPGARGATPRPRRRGGGPRIHAAHHARWWRGAPGGRRPAAAPRRPPPWVPEGRARVARSPIASRTRASSPRGRAEPRRAGAEERSDRTAPTFARRRHYAPRPPWVERRFSRAFFLFSFKCNAVQSPSSPPPVGPRREPSALRSPFASPR